MALTVLDEHIARGPDGPASSQTERAKRRRHRLPSYRLVRYADDWCLMVSGTKDDAEALREEIAGVLSVMGLRLSPEKTLITHIDECLDFLGWRIQRHRKRGSNRHYVYTYPSGKAVKAMTGKVRAMRRTTDTSQPLDALLRQLNGAQRLVRLLPARRVQRDLRLPELLHVAPGRELVAPQTPPGHLEGSPPPLLRRRMVADIGRKAAVQPGQGNHHALPLPRNSHPDPVAEPGMRTPHEP